MDSILINGQDVPVLNSENLGNSLPLVTHKGHHGAVATTKEDVEGLMFDGISFWCPIEFTRAANADENIRRTPLTQEEIDRYISMIEELEDIGVLIATEDETGESLLKFLDGNNRRRLFEQYFDKATHVFLTYREVTSKLEAMRVQSVANTHTQTTHESEAFKALEAKNLTDALPKAQKESELSFFYAEIAKGSRGKTEFTKRWKRAKYAIPAVWSALSENKITVEVIDHLATLINPDTEEVLADLQQEILDSAIAQNLKASQVQTKCAAAFANWEQSQKAVEEDDDEEIDLPPPSAPSRPTSVKALVPQTTMPSVEVEKVTSLDVELQRQATKATKGKGGKTKVGSSGSKGKTLTSKVTTNAPASIPDAIAANSTTVISSDQPKPRIKDVDPYALLYAFERELVDGDILNSTGELATPSFVAKLKKADQRYIDDLLSQVLVMRSFLNTIESTAIAAKTD